MGNPALIEELERQFGDNPQRVFARLASEYRKAGELARAIELCRTYVPQQPGYISGHIVLGQALYESGEHDEAQQTFETALQLDPENLIALRQLGDIAYARGDLAGARSWYARLLDVDPQNEEVVAQLAALDNPTAAASFSSTPAASAASAAPTVSSVAAGPAERASEPNAAPAELALDRIAAEVQDALPAGAGTPGAAALRPDSPADAESTPGRRTPSDAELSAWWESDTEATAEAEPAAAAPDREENGAPQPSIGLETFAAMFGETAISDAVAEPEPIELPIEGLTAAGESPFIDLGAPSSQGAESGHSRPVAPASDLSLPPLEIESMELELGSSAAPSPDAAGERRPWSPLDSTPTEAPSEAEEPEPPFATTGRSDGTSAGEAPAPWSPFTSDAPSGSSASEPDPDTASDSAGAERRNDIPDAFVTETMAELYVQQGLLRQAVELYRRLADLRPDEEALRARLSELEEELALANSATSRSAEPQPLDLAVGGDEPWSSAPSAAVSDAPAGHAAGDAVRDRSAESAAPEPAIERVFEAPVERAPVRAAEAPGDVPTQAAAATEPATAPRGSARGPTVRAFFSALGTHRSGRVTPPRPVPNGAEAATGATGFAAKSGDSPGAVPAVPDDVSPAQDEPVHAAASEAPRVDLEPPHDLPGTPSRAATSALSLDEVFRETMGRAGSGAHPESLDEFFAGAEESDDGDAAAEGGAPPPSAAADLEAFNAWLEGLKK